MIKQFIFTAAIISLIGCGENVQMTELTNKFEKLSKEKTELIEQTKKDAVTIDGLAELLKSDSVQIADLNEIIVNAGDRMVKDYSENPKYEKMSLADCISAINDLDKFYPFLKLSAGFVGESYYSALITLEDSAFGIMKVRKDFKFREGRTPMSLYTQYKELVYTSPDKMENFKVGYYGSIDNGDAFHIYSVKVKGKETNFEKKMTFNEKLTPEEEKIRKDAEHFYRSKRVELKTRFKAPYRIIFSDISGVPVVNK